MARIYLPGVLVQSEDPGGKDRSARGTGAVRRTWWQGYICQGYWCSQKTLVARVDLPGVLMELEDPGGKDRSARGYWCSQKTLVARIDLPGGTDVVRRPWWQG